MSRSNPSSDAPNPAERFFEWVGSEGHFRYYDKTKKEQVNLKPDWTFILLDQLATVKGFHEPSQSGIYSNEVRDTRSEPMLVKAFEGGKIACGIYAQIRDRVAAAGGRFTANCYCAFKDGENLKLGAVQFRGAALGAWFEFSKANKKALYEKAVRVKGSKKEKKGKVEYHVPVFELVDVGEATQKAAVTFDLQVQEYLTNYLARTRVEQVDAHAPPPVQQSPVESKQEWPTEAPERDYSAPAEPEPDDVPF